MKLFDEELKIENIYQYYDEPLLFTCIGSKGTRYLSLLVDEEDECSVWLYLLLDDQLHNDLISSKIDIKSAYLHSTVYKIWTELNTGSLVGTVQLDSNDIDMEDLPFGGEYLLG